jgi:hypothetical protein
MTRKKQILTVYFFLAMTALPEFWQVVNHGFVENRMVGKRAGFQPALDQFVWRE